MQIFKITYMNYGVWSKSVSKRRKHFETRMKNNASGIVYKVFLILTGYSTLISFFRMKSGI